MKIISFLLSPIRWALKFLLKCALILVLLLVVILACGNLWLPWVINWQSRSLTGFNTTIQSSKGSLFKGNVDFQNVTIKNPNDKFSETSFISFNDLDVDVKLTSIFSNTILLENILIDIDNVTIVKNKEGIYNYSVFADNISSIGKSDATGDNKNTNKANNKEASKSTKNLVIEKFTFSINSIKIIDESDNSVKEFSIKYKREFSNISDISSIIKPLVADLGMYGLTAFIQATFQSIGELPGINQATQGIIKIKNTSKEAIKGTKNTIKGIQSNIKDIFSK